MSRPAAGRLVRAAEHVRRFEATADALADGVVTTEKVELLAEAARHREQFYEHDERLLLDATATLDARDLTTVTRTWRMLADDELASSDATKAFERVHLHVSNTLLGGVLSGFLDPQGSVLLTTALDLLEPPDPVGGADVPRTLSQRRGEALVKLAQHYLDTRGHSPGTRAVPTVEAIVTVSSSAEGAARFSVDDRCELDGFGPVPLDAVLRLACESRVGWLIVNGEREVLDMGRRSRSVSPAQRRAVRARDRHCRYPGCRAQARWCDVHHLVEWERGGATDLGNLVLLCRRHHVAVHEGSQRLVRLPDGKLQVETRARGPSG
jgi:hypothetical protein